jgi:hypothetical protein
LLVACQVTGAPANSGPPPEAQAAGEAKDGGEKAEPEALLTAPDIVPMPSLNIPMLKGNRIAGTLSVEVMIDIATQERMDEFYAKRSRLAARYADALSKWASAFQDVRAPANVIAIKNQLQNVTNEVLGGTGATVLLQSAMLRRKG